MIAIVGVLAVIFIWGPGKLPEMARSIGQAKAEYDKALKAVTLDLSSITNPTTTTPAQPAVLQTPTPQPPTSSEDPIIIAAKNLGINTEGKSKEELAKEILERTSKT
jgi:sec-independent protein translocase protein TatA